MQIAALYDIHGNLPALNAVLRQLEEIQPDLIVVGGDIVSGPLPGKTLERLAAYGDRVRYIRGNNDREVVMAFDGVPLPDKMSPRARQEVQWEAGQLTSFQRDFLAQLPEQFVMSGIDSGEILFCHATPNSDEEIFTPLSSHQRLTTIFGATEQKLVVCGHTHLQFELQVGDVRIVNAGSVGMPFADTPGACWLMLSPDGYEFRRTTYDLEAAAHEIRAGGHPHAQEFVEDNVLTVPTVAQAQELLQRLEMMG
ncbi:metallophosphoesterase family protein [Alicyclobacillus curvatus]|jgi:putative phosphoesterase|nr:metallophosphoesterase family protein [Alicyclobacillus curvatus]